eukprot:m.32921 g.32921  ORF g.32921 m.32921 type:complete len:442 (+) comp8467_c0_seq1:78-1403(+)
MVGGGSSSSFWTCPLENANAPGRVHAVTQNFTRAWPTRALEGASHRFIQDAEKAPPSNPLHRLFSLRLNSHQRATHISQPLPSPPIVRDVLVRLLFLEHCCVINKSKAKLVEDKSSTKEDDTREARLSRLIDSPSLDVESLRKLCWAGIPSHMRPTLWRILSGYLPANVDRRPGVMTRRRAEYHSFVEQHYGARSDASNKQMLHQIQVDILRTTPTSIFSQEVVKEIFERLLFVFHVRHPGTGYVQGMNDLAVPFFSVFISSYNPEDIESTRMSAIPRANLAEIEADTYFCFCNLVDMIQDYFTPDRHGLQRQVHALEDIMGRINPPLNEHLSTHGVTYLQFAFRWMNCLLMRELPLKAIIRLWDTYLSEGDSFTTLHLYTSAALLLSMSEGLLACKDLSEIMIFVQSLPTESWGEREVAELLAEAYRLKFSFHEAQKHFT